jgi:hypothetical protein
VAYTSSQFAPGGIIPQDDGYAPGDAAIGNPVRQLGSVNRNAAFVRPAAAAGPHIPIAGVAVIAGIIGLMEWRRIKAFARRVV